MEERKVVKSPPVPSIVLCQESGISFERFLRPWQTISLVSGPFNCTDSSSLRHAWNTTHRRLGLGPNRTESYPLLAIRKPAPTVAGDRVVILLCYLWWSNSLPNSLVCSSPVLAGHTPRPVALCSHTGCTRSATLLVGVGLSLAVLHGEPVLGPLLWKQLDIYWWELYWIKLIV